MAQLETILLAVVSIETSLIGLLWGKTLIESIKDMWAGKRSFYIFYVNEKNVIELHRKKVGSKQSSFDIQFGSKRYIFDPQRVYKLPSTMPVLGGKPCLFYTYKDTRAVNFYDLFPEVNKTPEELDAMLRSKVFIEMMQGPNDLMKSASSMMLLLLVGAGVYLLGTSQGWF